jgi:predicted KAP-like P-loop ATPase
LAPHEVNLITDRLLSRARAATSWGTPNVLWALLTVTQRTGEHVERVARFLRETPPAQRTAAIVPVLGDKPWARSVLSAWAGETGTPDPVKKAITSLAKKAAT